MIGLIIGKMLVLKLIVGLMICNLVVFVINLKVGIWILVS